MSYFFVLYGSPSSLCLGFDSVSFEINRFANVFVFGDFNVHHKVWLTYSGGTDRRGELFYNFSFIISNDLTQIVKYSYSDP